VGSLDGSGCLVGKFDGNRVGAPVGSSFVEFDGPGATEGGLVGCSEGSLVDGTFVGRFEGVSDGLPVGAAVVAIPKVDSTVGLFQHSLDLPKGK
jgi:hypothetical protein